MSRTDGSFLYMMMNTAFSLKKGNNENHSADEILKECTQEFRDFDRDIVAERVNSNAKTGNCDRWSAKCW